MTEMKTNMLVVKLFILTDPMKGFEEDNRTYLRSVCFGCIADIEVKDYKNSEKHVEPLLLYKWWNNDKSYYDIKYSNYDEFCEITDTERNFYRYFFIKQFDAIHCAYLLSENKDQKKEKDPDAYYLPYVNAKCAINYQQRHLLETIDPVVYGHYTIERQYGCMHGVRGAYIYCQKCDAIFGCIICHNLEVDDHAINSTSEIQQVECCKCNKRQPIGEKCVHCDNIFSNCYCSKCKTIQIYDLSVEPYWHCDKCNKCHFGFKQEHSKYCSLCNQCIAIYDYKTHICNYECICPICQDQIYFNQDHITLKCNPKHKVHEQCYAQYREKVASSHLCPYCKQLILSEIDVNAGKCNAIYYLMNKKISHYIWVLYLLHCNACEKDLVSIDETICRSCWMECNVKQSYSFTKNSMVDILKGKFDLQNNFIQQNKELIIEMIKDMFITYQVIYRKLQRFIFEGHESNDNSFTNNFDLDVNDEDNEEEEEEQDYEESD